MKVFGIGLSRTGTKSLTIALTVLGYKIIHYPLSEKFFHELLTGNGDFSLLKNYDGITDIPIIPAYKQLQRRYPDAKFILTVRDIEEWIAALDRHYKRSERRAKSPQELFVRASVYGCYQYNEERFRDVQKRHHADVLDYFSAFPSKLLVMNISNGDGWPQLTEFLGGEVPDISFPT